jgi:hypothetical protein
MRDHRDDSAPGAFVMREDEILRDEERRALHGIPVRLTDEQRATLKAARDRRRDEDAAAAEQSHHYFTRTYRGREAQARYNAAVRARLDETKETA